MKIKKEIIILILTQLFLINHIILFRSKIRLGSLNFKRSCSQANCRLPFSRICVCAQRLGFWKGQFVDPSCSESFRILSNSSRFKLVPYSHHLPGGLLTRVADNTPLMGSAAWSELDDCTPNSVMAVWSSLRSYLTPNNILTTPLNNIYKHTIWRGIGYYCEGGIQFESYRPYI